MIETGERFVWASEMASDTTDLLKTIFRGDASTQASAADKIVSIAEAWMPSARRADYKTEMSTRHQYLQKSMQRDMAVRLQEWFPRTYTKLYDRQYNLAIRAHMIAQMAKVFVPEGEFYLEDKNGERITDSEVADLFQEMLELGGFSTAFVDVDRVSQNSHRAALRFQWDHRARCVLPQVWSPELVNIVPHPLWKWDCDYSPAVAWSVGSGSGLRSVFDDRWEVFAKAVYPDEAGNMKWESRYYYAIRREAEEKPRPGEPVVYDWQRVPINGDAIPFEVPAWYSEEDQAMGPEPMYPWTWWRADSFAELYALNEEDALTANRNLNALVTDMVRNIHEQAWGIKTWKKDNSVGDIQVPAQIENDAENVLDLPSGVSLEFVAPKLPLTEVKEVFSLLVDLDAKLNGQPGSILKVEAGNAESGIALKIKNIPAEEHRNRMIAIYKPQVVDALVRAMVVWDAYAEHYGRKKFGIAEGSVRPMWDPADMEVPTDEEAEARKEALLIGNNVLTAEDQYMRVHGEADREVAKARIEENSEINQERAKAKFELQSAMPGPWGQKPPPENAPQEDKPEQDDKDKPVPPKDDEKDKDNA